MNMLLHGIGQASGSELIEVRDSLAKTPSTPVDIVLANPPFGVGTVTGENYATSRMDLWTETTNKQLNFVQHIYTLLKLNGRAAVVVPDNVLFESGAGETIRRKLLQQCDVHTCYAADRNLLRRRRKGQRAVLRQEAATTGWVPRHKAVVGV